jgi:hypothetical protein
MSIFFSLVDGTAPDNVFLSFLHGCRIHFIDGRLSFHNSGR